MMTEEYKIKLSNVAKLFALHTPRRTPLTLLVKVSEELQHMEKLEMISIVNKPCDWFAGIVVVPKTKYVFVWI